MGSATRKNGFSFKSVSGKDSECSFTEKVREESSLPAIRCREPLSLSPILVPTQFGAGLNAHKLAKTFLLSREHESTRPCCCLHAGSAHSQRHSTVVWERVRLIAGPNTSLQFQLVLAEKAGAGLKKKWCEPSIGNVNLVQV